MNRKHVKDALEERRKHRPRRTPKRKISCRYSGRRIHRMESVRRQRSNNGGNNQRGNGTGQKDRQNSNTVPEMAQTAVETTIIKDPEMAITEENVPETVRLTEESAPGRIVVRTETTITVETIVRMEEEIARVRKADSPVREEEMTADRTTEEITEEEMTEDRRMEEELLRPFLHQLFRSRNHSARRARRTIKRKITGMTTEKKDFQKGKKQKPMSQPVKPQPKPVEKEEEKIKMITIPETLTIQELADKMKIQPSVIVKKLFMQGKIVTVNQEVDFDTAEEIAMEFECLVEKEEVVDVIEELIKRRRRG